MDTPTLFPSSRIDAAYDECIALMGRDDLNDEAVEKLQAAVWGRVEADTGWTRDAAEAEIASRYDNKLERGARINGSN
jgi:hypothetical protein